MPAIHHRYISVDGHRLFFREAGDPSSPTVVLLHGFPTSSYTFRGLIPQLADRYHVIAPDHLGFGLSDAPPVDQFDYTFDALADLTEGLLRALGVVQYAMYVQDYGAPIGWRLALRDPDAITAIVTQNGNGYDAGFVEDFWKGSGRINVSRPAPTRPRSGSSSPWRPPAGSISPACPTKPWSTRNLGITTSLCCPGPATNRSS